MDAIIHSALVLLYLAFFSLLISKWKFFRLDAIPLRWIQAVLIVKLLAGLGLWAIYHYYYTYRETGDAFRYFDDAMILHSSLGDDPVVFWRFLFGLDLRDPALSEYSSRLRAWYSAYNYGVANDNPTVVRVNMLIALVSFGYYHVHTIFMSFFSLIGGIGIYRFLADRIERGRRILFLACMLIPGVLFWSSGVLKEPLLFLALGLTLWALKKITEAKWTFLFPLVIFGLFLFFIKPYVVIAFIPGLLYYLWKKLQPGINGIVQWVILHVLSLLLALNAGYFYPPGDLLYILNKKRTDFYNVANDQEAGSTILLPEIGNWLDWILNWPEYLAIAYFRPHLFEVSSFLYAFAAFENLAFFLLLLAAVIGSKAYRKIDAPAFGLSLSFVLCLGIIIGSTVPVLGAVVRYKIPALIFFFYLCLPGLNYIVQKIMKGKKTFLQD